MARLVVLGGGGAVDCGPSLLCICCGVEGGRGGSRKSEK